MAEDLLKAKGDTDLLGIHWLQKFLGRYPEPKSKYVPLLDKERAEAQDPKVINEWFCLFQKLKEQHKICDGDIYSIDEKGFAQGVLCKLKVLLSKHVANKHITQCGNLE